MTRWSRAVLVGILLPFDLAPLPRYTHPDCTSRGDLCSEGVSPAKDRRPTPQLQPAHNQRRKHRALVLALRRQTLPPRRREAPGPQHPGPAPRPHHPPGNPAPLAVPEVAPFPARQRLCGGARGTPGPASGRTRLYHRLRWTQPVRMHCRPHRRGPHRGHRTGRSRHHRSHRPRWGRGLSPQRLHRRRHRRDQGPDL